ncbi:DUF6531 domain-containing protein, partial [Streptomyces sp. SID12501]|nr:hypothetical protein [Streptomyces sp. SID12501]
MPSGRAHLYQAVVASARDWRADVQARSNGFSAPSGGGPVLPFETAGGTNLSGSCSQRCHGDPVNSVTGEFWESVSDLQVPGAGPGLSWSRSFATTRASTTVSLGYGWSTGYDIRLAPSGGSSLDFAPWIEVVQENGSSTVFTADGDGGFSAPLRVFATLERLGDGSYRFVRRGSQTFMFDHSGRLTRVED